MFFAKNAPDLMQRLPGLPTTPHLEFLLRRKPKPSPLFHKRLAELLCLDHLTPVYHGEQGLRTLKELVRSYLTVTKISHG
jgi:hypothetical protein